VLLLRSEQECIHVQARFTCKLLVRCPLQDPIASFSFRFKHMTTNLFDDVADYASFAMAFVPAMFLFASSPFVL